MLPFPLLLSTIFLLCFPHSCSLNSKALKNHKTFCNKRKQLQQLLSLFLSFNFPPISFVFGVSYHLLINTSSLKLWWSITITFCVPCTTMWKHVTKSLWMNALDIIFWLLYIHSLPRSTILTLLRSPCTSITNCVDTFVESINRFIDCVDTSIELANTTKLSTLDF
jgi:hypothetical protein